MRSPSKKLDFEKLQAMDDGSFQELLKIANLKIQSVDKSLNDLDRKSYIMLMLYSILMLVFSNFGINYFDEYMIQYLVLIFFFFISTCFFIASILPAKSYGIGFKPSDIINDMDNHFLNNKRKFLSVSIRNYDVAINFNSDLVSKKGRYLQIGMILFPIGVLLFFLLLII